MKLQGSLISHFIIIFEFSRKFLKEFFIDFLLFRPKTEENKVESGVDSPVVTAKSDDQSVTKNTVESPKNETVTQTDNVTKNDSVTTNENNKIEAIVTQNETNTRSPITNNETAPTVTIKETTVTPNEPTPSIDQSKPTNDKESMITEAIVVTAAIATTALPVTPMDVAETTKESTSELPNQEEKEVSLSTETATGTTETSSASNEALRIPSPVNLTVPDRSTSNEDLSTNASSDYDSAESGSSRRSRGSKATKKKVRKNSELLEDAAKFMNLKVKILKIK